MVATRILSLFKKKSVIAGIAVVVLFAGWFFLIRDGGGAGYETVAAERGALIQEVSVTGKLEAAESAELSFERGGRVALIGVPVGREAVQGALLMSLTNADLAAQVAEAQSSLREEEAKLEQLRRGSRSEEIAVSQAEVVSARVTLRDAERILGQRVSDAYSRTDDAIRTQADQFFSSAQSASPQLSFATDQQLEVQLEQGRIVMEEMLTEWKSDIAPTKNLFSRGDQSLDDLADAQDFLAATTLALSSAAAYSSISASTVSGWSADISAARTSLNTAQSNITAAIGSVERAEASLSLAERELSLAEAGATPEDIRIEEAAVARAEAMVLSAQAELAKSVIRAPFTGVVTRIDAKVGETVSAHTPVVSLLSPAYFEIETFVPEADIAKISFNDPARVTLDAYEEDVVFVASVIAIDPAETVLEGVSTYKVTLAFIDERGLGKPGMTANVDIITDERESVIAIPARAVETDGSRRFVRVLTPAGALEERDVTVGLRGSDGRVEIVSGVSAGDQVVLFFP